MNSNYGWQKHQANERLQARLHKAEIHRSLRRRNKEGAHPSFSLGRIVLLPATVVAAWLKRLIPQGRSSEAQSIQST